MMLPRVFTTQNLSEEAVGPPFAELSLPVCQDTLGITRVYRDICFLLQQKYMRRSAAFDDFPPTVLRE